MNKEIFNQLIKNPANVGPEHKENLKKLVDTFPYAANIRLLYLSSLLNDADVLFEQELKKTAAYISDRRILKKIISKTRPKEDYFIPEPPMRVVHEKEKGSDSLEDEITTQKEVEKSTEAPTKEKTRTEKLNHTDESIEKSEYTEDASKKSTEIDQENKEPIPNTESQSISELDSLIVSSAIGASISLDIDKVSTEINKEKIKENNKPKSFLEWIKASTVEEIKPELSPKQKERIEFKERAEILIDQFIQNQPKIKPKAEFYSAENMAKKSIEDSGVMVTETLAKVYANQGNVAKAKSIYNQLILKNPEKKSYFASLINDLRSE